nr:unnamed protein product [Digitaria exilis]
MVCCSRGLGIARRIDEAFEILESIEKDSSIGSPRLSPHLICGFLNALIEAGDMRRANALVARFRKVLYEGHSVLLYNLLMKGYIKSNFPLGALTVKDEILRQGLKPDRLTYNTIISACVKSAEIDKAIQFLEDMKEEAKRESNPELLPDAVTYTTLLKVAVKVESLSGFTNSLLRPHVFPQIILNDPVEKYMVPFQESRPLPADAILRKVVMRFLKDRSVPLVDDWGGCVGIVHRDDCTKLDAPLLSMSRGPPLCVPTSTTVEHVIDLLLREKSEMVVVVKSGNMYEGNYTSSSRPLGVFSLAILWNFSGDCSSDIHDADISRVTTLMQELQDAEACNCG